MIIYLLAITLALLGIGLAGIITDKHLVVIMLGIEIIFVASIIALVTFISYNQNPNPDSVIMLIAIWSVAAVEIITLVTFYIYMRYRNIDFDITKLSKMKW